MMDFNAAQWTLLGVGYLVIINIITFIAFDMDKDAAIKGRRRISESSLLKLAFIGGSAGAIIAQRWLRHKTRKQPFKSQLYFIIFLQIVLMIILCIPSLRVYLFDGIKDLSSGERM